MILETQARPESGGLGPREGVCFLPVHTPTGITINRLSPRLQHLSVLTIPRDLPFSVRISSTPPSVHRPSQPSQEELHRIPLPCPALVGFPPRCAPFGVSTHQQTPSTLGCPSPAASFCLPWFLMCLLLLLGFINFLLSQAICVCAVGFRRRSRQWISPSACGFCYFHNKD